MKISFHRYRHFIHSEWSKGRLKTFYSFNDAIQKMFLGKLNDSDFGILIEIVFIS